VVENPPLSPILTLLEYLYPYLSSSYSKTDPESSTMQNPNSNDEAAEAAANIQENERRESWSGRKSILRMLYRLGGRPTYNELYIAHAADSILSAEKKYLAREYAKRVVHLMTQLGYVHKFRHEISDYQRRRLPKFKFGRRVVYFVPSHPSKKDPGVRDKWRV